MENKLLMPHENITFASPSTALYFETDAKWADEFLKNVWHSSEEEPKKNRYILIEAINTLTPNNKIQYYAEYTEDCWRNIMKKEGFQCRWAYIKDLIPKNK